MKFRMPLFKVFSPPWEKLGPELKRVLESGYIAEGDDVAAFEDGLRHATGWPHVFATNSGTSALQIALKASGIRGGGERRDGEVQELKEGDVVVVPPMTCVATVAPVLAMGARVLWCDVHPDTGLIDIERGLMNPGVPIKALIAVDWGGDLAPITKLSRWCQANGVALIEDAAQAFGTHTSGADFRCFSFQAIKTLTTGDGGCVLAKTRELAERGKRLSWFGISRKNFRLPTGEIDWDADIPELGFKANMNNLTAALGSVQLKYHAENLKKHRANGALYANWLRDIPEIQVPDREGSACWVCTVTCQDRDGLLAHLQHKGIQASRMHARLDRYSGVPSIESRRFYGVESFSARVLCLPCGWWVDPEDVREVVKEIKAFYAHKS